MKSNIITAAILAIGLVASAFLYSGRYQMLVVDRGIAVRLDRWTGETKAIRMNADGWDDLPAYRKSN